MPPSASGPSNVPPTSVGGEAQRLSREGALEVSATPEHPGVTTLREKLGAFAASVITPRPETFDDDGSVQAALNFIRAGGRLPGIDYNKIPAEQRETGFREAREFLNRPMHSVVNGAALGHISGAPSYSHPNPNDPTERFGAIYPLGEHQVGPVMNSILEEQQSPIPSWDGPENLQARIATIDKAMAIMYTERDFFAALLALSGGKSGNECFRDMQELFDFANNYRMVEQALALRQVSLRSNGDTSIAARPLDKPVGIWQPFNFPCIGIGEMIAAMIAGDTAIVHTSARMVGPYLWAYQKFLEAGVPVTRLHFVIPDGDENGENIDPSMSKALAEHHAMGNIFFTGSYGVANQLAETQLEKGAALGRLDMKLHAESGGYNPMVISGFPEGAITPLEEFAAENRISPDSAWDTFLAELPADSFLASFREALIDSACGLQGHKCSALHEVIVNVSPSGFSSRQAALLKSFAIAVMNRVKVADVTKDPEARMGGLIDSGMHGLIAQQVHTILRRGGRILTGNGTLEERMSVEGLPNAMKPIIYEDPNRVAGQSDVEIFGPVFRWLEVDSAEAAVTRAQGIPYALTSAVIAPTREQALAIRDVLPNGVGYVNGPNYAPTTTAAPAPQIPFGGIKGSGTASGLLRPGTADHVLAFMDVYSRANFPRIEWGKGQGADPVIAAIVALLDIHGFKIERGSLITELGARLGSTTK